MIHMAITEWLPGDGWLWRCGKKDHNFATQAEARKAGDAHLAEANA